MTSSPTQLSLEDYVQGVRANDRVILARAITLVESRSAGDRAMAHDLLAALLPDSGGAIRLGITGAPGVGKSTTIDTLGSMLTTKGHKIAVLAIDPSSTRTGGSILGDKTRMTNLAVDHNAFIRPSPTRGTLGGVASNTQDAIVLCEAAGFDIVIVETVGIGQSEMIVADMVDFFMVLILPGGGDELQGIKKGIVEHADMIAVNKADGDNKSAARQTASAYQAALNIFNESGSDWKVPVATFSGLMNDGVDDLWRAVEQHRKITQKSGLFDEKRRAQALGALHRLLDERLRAVLLARPEVRKALPSLEDKVGRGKLTAGMAVEEILALI